MKGAVRIAGHAPMLVLAALVIAALAAGVVAPASPTEMTRGAELLPPSLAHPFGTDELGRDLWSRSMYGLRLSLGVALLATAVGGGAGTALGALAGFRGGALDAVAMRAVDGLLAIPAILFGIAIIAALGPGARNVALTLALVQLPVFARVTRGAVLAERHEDYVLAATAVGASQSRILVRHVLRNAAAPIVVQTALALGFAVLVEASLSFLGLGIRSPDPSLGSILGASRDFLRTAPTYALLPGSVLVLLLFSLNGAADQVNDLLNPRQR